MFNRMIDHDGRSRGLRTLAPAHLGRLRAPSRSEALRVVRYGDAETAIY